MGILTLLALLAPAHAQSLADEAEVHFSEGARAYDNFRYAEALAHFMVSNRLSPNWTASMNVGHTYAALKKYPEAYRWYAVALRLADEEDRTAIRSAMKRIESRVVLVEVESDPAGATVYLNEKDLGAVATTPATIAVAPGEYSVIFEREGHRTVTVPPQRLERVATRTEVTARLPAITGSVQITGPSEATAHVGSPEAEIACWLPCVLDLPIGQQILYFKQEGHAAQPALFTLEEGAELRIQARLDPLVASIEVDATEPGSLVTIDGTAAGYTPAVLQGIPVGQHRIRITKPGFAPWEAALELAEGERVQLGRIELSPTFTVSAASKVAQDVAEAPASVSLITAQEIRAFGYQTVYEAIGGLRGMYQTNDLTYQALGIRGFGRVGDYGNRLLTTIDGHTANDDQIGSSYIGDDFLTDLSDVRQIELVRGPGSALYGSNAVFGVVNLEMRDAATPNRPHVRLSADGTLLRAKAGTGFGDDELGGYLSVGGSTSNGRDYTFPSLADPATGSDGRSVDADGLRQHMAMGKVWAGDLTVSATWFGRQKAIPTGSFDTVLGDPRATSDDYRGYLEARYRRDLGEQTHLDIRLYGDTYRYHGVYPYAADDLRVDTYQGAWVGLEPRLSRSFGEVADLTVGAESRQHFLSQMRSFQQDALDGEPLSIPLDEQPTFQVYSAYAVADVHPGELLRVNLGGRFDAYATAVEPLASFNPRAAVILTPGDEILKVMGGTAFRAPSPYEYFYGDGGISQVRPDSLLPESILTAEAEWTHRFDDVVSTTLASYYNRISNLVDTEDVDADTFRFANLTDRVESVGAEAQITRAWRSGWMLDGQVSWQRTRVGGLDGGERLTNSPEWLGAVKGVVPLGSSTRLATRWRVESPRLTNAAEQTPLANLVDVTLSGETVQPNIEWGVGVRNLLDTKVLHPAGAGSVQDVLPQLGRSFYVSVKGSLQ